MQGELRRRGAAAALPLVSAKVKSAEKFAMKPFANSLKISISGSRYKMLAPNPISSHFIVKRDERLERLSAAAKEDVFVSEV